jgi:hypothetical protein
MNYLLLFDIPVCPVEEITLPKPKYRCRNCIHSYKHNYGKMYYCEMQRDVRTSYGHTKIKMNSHACELFQKQEK